jgi:zinc transporter
MPKQQNHILFSYSFNENGDAVKIDESKVANELKNPSLSWVHLDGVNKSTKKWLQKEVDYLDSLIIDALIAEETRPRIVRFEHGMLLILRGINETKNSKISEMVSVRIWIDSERVITIQKRPMKSIFEIEKKINDGFKIKNSGEFLYNLITLTLQNISEYIYATGEKIDEIEQEVLNTRNMKYREIITHTRSQLTVSRRYLFPQKDVILSLRNCQYQWIDEYAIRHFQEDSDQIIHTIEEVDEVLMRSKILHDELSHALNEKINNNMFKLSMIAIIFMPLTFITSLFGMNFQKIPGAGNPNGFYITCIVMTILTIAQMVFYKKKDWF